MTTLELPKVTSVPIPLDEFAAYMEEKRTNGCRGLRDQFLVREKGGRERERKREGEGEGERERGRGRGRGKCPHYCEVQDKYRPKTPMLLKQL